MSNTIPFPTPDSEPPVGWLFMVRTDREGANDWKQLRALLDEFLAVVTLEVEPDLAGVNCIGLDAVASLVGMETGSPGMHVEMHPAVTFSVTNFSHVLSLSIDNDAFCLTMKNGHIFIVQYRKGEKV